MDNKDKELEITWNWFKFHANQRFTAFYYYLIIIGALAFGYLQCFNGCEQVKVLTPFLSLSGLLVSVAFLCIEIRNVELVNIGRKTLRDLGYKPTIIDGIYVNDAINGKLTPDQISEYKKIKEESLKPGKIPREYILHEFWFRFIYLLIAFFSSLSIIHYYFTFFSWGPFIIFVIIILFPISSYVFWFKWWKREDKKA